MLRPTDAVTPGMKVTAKHSDLIVVLQIKNEMSAGRFAATVLSFELVLASRPCEIVVGDDVVIEREFICCIYGP